MTTSTRSFITLTTENNNGDQTETELWIDDRHEWNTYRLAAEQYLEATRNILFCSGTVIVSTRYAEVTINSEGPSFVLLDGTVGVYRPTTLSVMWVNGPESVVLKIDGIDTE